MKKLFVSALLVSILLLISMSSLLALEEGAAAPDFELKTLGGETVHLSDFKGRIILLKLATTWCPTCMQQSQEIRSIAPFLVKNDVAVVEVFVQDTEEMIRDYMKKVDYPMPHVALHDHGKVAKAYNVYLIPRVLLIGRDFKVCRDGNIIDGKDLTRQIEKLL